MSQVDAYCKGCRYLGTNSYGKWCRYNDMTGHVRGCQAGLGCLRHTNPSAAGSVEEVLSGQSHKKPSKPWRPPAGSPEEAYEREKVRRKAAAQEYKAKANGRQRAVIIAYKEATGDSNYEISKKIGISEGRVQKWITEYAPANWDKLAIIGISKPEGL